MENKETFIQELADKVIAKFRLYCTEEERSKYTPHPALEVQELTDDVIRNIVTEYFEKKTLTEADNYIYDVISQYVENTYDQIDWSNGMTREEREEKDPAYIKWRRNMEVREVWGDVRRILKLSNKWVEVNGKANTDEEAARKAADKWCELIFGWHLQDNGALNEDHGGGFYACALGTLLANKSKENITEDVKVKAHNLFYEYYLHAIHFNRSELVSEIMKDVEWAKKNIPDTRDGRSFDWEYGFNGHSMYCDYGPTTPLYLLLVAAGVPANDAGNICPWKTGIEIRPEDNAVMYLTYQHRDEI